MPDGKRAAFMKGAPDEVLQKCTRILEEGRENPKKGGLYVDKADGTSNE